MKSFFLTGIVAVLQECCNVILIFSIRESGKFQGTHTFAMHGVVMLLRYIHKLECGPMPNVMVALPNIGGALCSMPQSFADAHY